ncbi:MAG TPA: nuclear transport factor 2 family protein [Solirubrobacteraceae bacterium]|nr:nuclear transport factor 2 family protein [Solirubrobacteraceae bacterium]
MSQENVEIVKDFTRLFEQGDRDEWREFFAPNVVWDTSASGMPAAGIFHGHEGIVRFFRDWLGTWRDYAIAAREYLDAGDSVVVVFRQRGTGRGSGVEIDRDFFGVYDLSGHKVVRFRLFESRVEALKAVGLAE